MYDPPGPTPNEIVVFEAAGQRFGVPAAQVREIVRAVTLAAAPGAEPTIKGILNLRGQFVAVFDVRAVLQLPPTPIEPTDHFIVTRAGDQWLAFRADRALDLAPLSADSVQPAGSIIRNWDAVAGAARVHGQLVLLLDPGRLVAQGAFVGATPSEPSRQEAGP